MNLQCPGTCSVSQKGCSILITTYCLALPLPMSGTNMSMIQALLSLSSDLIRGETVSAPTRDHICSAILNFWALSGVFLLQTTGIALHTRSKHYKDLPLLQLEVSKTKLYFICIEPVPYILTDVFSGYHQTTIKTFELVYLLYLYAKYPVSFQSFIRTTWSVYDISSNVIFGSFPVYAS